MSKGCTAIIIKCSVKKAARLHVIVPILGEPGAVSWGKNKVNRGEILVLKGFKN